MNNTNKETKFVSIIKETKETSFKLSDNLNNFIDFQNKLQNKIPSILLLKENDYKKNLDSLMELYNKLDNILVNIKNENENEIRAEIDNEEVLLLRYKTGEWFIVDEDNLLYSPETNLLRGLKVVFNDSYFVHFYN